MNTTDPTARPIGPICVTSFQVSLEREDMSISLLLRFYPKHSPQEEMSLRFDGVRDLRFHGNPMLLGGIVVLEIEDILSSGWEEIRYKVTDQEMDFISFFCSSITRPQFPE